MALAARNPLVPELGGSRGERQSEGRERVRTGKQGVLCEAFMFVCMPAFHECKAVGCLTPFVPKMCRG